MVWRKNTYNIPFIRLHGRPTTQIGSCVSLVRLILPEGKYAVCYIWLFYHQIILTYWLFSDKYFRRLPVMCTHWMLVAFHQQTEGEKTHNSPDHAVSWLFVSGTLSLCPSGVSVEETPHTVTFNCSRVSIRGRRYMNGRNCNAEHAKLLFNKSD